MRGRMIKVLLVEDDEDDYVIVRDLLAEVVDTKYEVAWAHTYDEALERAGSIDHDICLLDFRLGSHNGLELFRELRKRGYRKPIILLTGQGDYQVDIEAMEAGAADYLTKGPQLNAPLLERSIRYAIEHSSAQQALRESEERFVLFMQYLPGAALIKDRDGRILYCNEYFAQIFDRQPWQLIGKTDFDFWPPAVAERMRQADQEVFASRRAVERVDEVDYRGSRLTYLTYKFPILREGTPLIGVISVDISARRRAEEHVRILNQQLIRTQENERQKLARDLHDVIGQDLSALKFGLESLFENFPDIPEGLRKRAAGLSVTLRAAHQNVRDLAHQLGASGLAHLGLASAAGDLCERFAAQNNIEVAFTALGMENAQLDFDLKINLYRILQESLNNVLKHAEASKVLVRLVRSFPNIIMRVEDNGRGFEVEQRMASGLAEQRMGLRSMEERVALLRGKMKIESLPGRGTRVYVEVPQQEERNLREND